MRRDVPELTEGWQFALFHLEALFDKPLKFPYIYSHIRTDFTLYFVSCLLLHDYE